MNIAERESFGHRTRETELPDCGLPPVRVILAAIVWLAARHKERATPQTRHALVCQAHRLLLHPYATPDDQVSGLRLAGLAQNEVLASHSVFLVGPGQEAH